MAEHKLDKPTSHTLRLLEEVDLAWLELVQRIRDFALQRQAFPIPVGGKPDNDVFVPHAEVPNAFATTVKDVKDARQLLNDVRTVLNDLKEGEALLRNTKHVPVDKLRGRGR